MLSSTVISENSEQCHSALRAFQEIFSQTNTITRSLATLECLKVEASFGHTRGDSAGRGTVEITALPLNVIRENMILNKILLNKRPSKNIFFSFYQQLTSFGYSIESPFSPVFSTKLFSYM